MRRILIVVALGVLIGAATLYYGLRAPQEGGPSGHGLRFVSLAWQEETLAENRAIVAEWNAAHPGKPVEYVQATWNSVHDYLITSFETGDVPDVFHYESSVIVDFAPGGFSPIWLR